MPPPLKSLLEYDTPSLVSTSKSKGAKDSKGAKKVSRLLLQVLMRRCRDQPLTTIGAASGTPATS
jgi:hypothetical protein